MPPEAASLYL